MLWLTGEGHSESRLYTVNVHCSRTTRLRLEAARVCFQTLKDCMLKGPDYIIYISLHLKASSCSKNSLLKEYSVKDFKNVEDSRGRISRGYGKKKVRRINLQVGAKQYRVDNEISKVSQINEEGRMV